MPTNLLNSELLIIALERFLEADRADKRDKEIKQPAAELERAMFAGFTKQGKLLLSSASKTKITVNGYLSALNKAQKQTYKQMSAALEKGILAGLELGGAALLDSFGIKEAEFSDDDLTGFDFNVVNQEAIKYAREHAAENVTKINDTTRAGLRSVITQATEEGWGYGRLAAQIGKRFDDLAGARARRIAVYELRDAYEAGQRVMIDRLGDHGLPMETRWLTAGDDRVRPSHQDSGAEGWNDVGFVFSSGGERPPTDPGCRCTALYRRKK